MKSNPIIFALDVPDLETATYYIDMLKDHVGMFKVGLELFIKEGPKVIEEIKKRCHNDIFLDLKLHDIPTTMERAIRSISKLDVYMTTIHVKNYDSLKAAHAGAEGNVHILAIAAMTSDLVPMGYLKTAELANIEACFGVVCSGLEVFHIKQYFPNLMAVVPGIRPGEDTHIIEGLEGSLMLEKHVNTHNKDHKRVVTPKEAIYYGADYLVIGRPIRDAEDPIEAVNNIIYSI